MPRSKTDFTNFIDSRPNYFPGQYLLEDDFELQEQYLSDRQMYHQKSLHVAGILEGLDVEVVQGQKAFNIKSGSAIDVSGNLIVCKKDFVFSGFGDITSGELYIQYTQVQQVKQQNDIPDSFTRWQEVPAVQFAAKAPDGAVKLAAIAIVNDAITINLGVRVYSGVFLPNPAGNDLTLRSGGNGNPNLAILTGSFNVTENLTVTGNAEIKGTITGSPNAYQKAQFTMSGGGTVTWGGSGGRLKWTSRFLAISMENSPSFPSGFININQPTANIPAAQVYDGKDRAADVSGVVLNGWEALYAVHTLGGNQDQVSFQIIRYTNSFKAPSNWLLVAVVNDDDKSIKLGTGAIINANGSYSSGSLFLSADKITAGVFSLDRIPTLTADKIPVLSADKITAGVFSLDRIPTLTADKIPVLSADKITAGTFSGDRIPTLTVDKIPALTADKIPPLTADKITAGVFSLDRIPTLTADKIPSNLAGGNISIANAYQKAQFTMSGGGTVTWGGAGGRLKWTSRFIAIAMENSPNILPAGHININQPTANIPAAQVWDGKDRIADGNGVVLNAWEALYAVHTVGGNQDQVSFRIVVFNNAFTAPSNWILVAVVNSDNNSIKLGTGVFINANGTYTAGSASTGSFSDLSIGGNLYFGAAVRQMINLWSTGYGIGVQNGTQYFRSDYHYAWYRGGAHANDTFNSGGGATLMTLNSAGTLTVTGAITPSVGGGTGNGIYFPENPGGGGGDAAWIRYYVRSGEACTLEIGIANDGDDILNLNSLNIQSRVPIGVYSSRELKENILDISDEEALETIENLRPVKYDYKDQKAARANIGFIAEEMPDNLASKDRKTISPTEMIPLLTKTIQNQQMAIRSLQEDLSLLKKSVHQA